MKYSFPRRQADAIGSRRTPKRVVILEQVRLFITIHILSKARILLASAPTLSFSICLAWFTRPRPAQSNGNEDYHPDNHKPNNPGSYTDSYLCAGRQVEAVLDIVVNEVFVWFDGCGVRCCRWVGGCGFRHFGAVALNGGAGRGFFEGVMSSRSACRLTKFRNGLNFGVGFRALGNIPSHLQTLPLILFSIYLLSANRSGVWYQGIRQIRLPSAIRPLVFWHLMVWIFKLNRAKPNGSYERWHIGMFKRITLITLIPLGDPIPLCGTSLK